VSELRLDERLLVTSKRPDSQRSFARTIVCFAWCLKSDVESRLDVYGWVGARIGASATDKRRNLTLTVPLQIIV